MYCRNCGKEVGEQELFCSACGAKVSVEEVENVKDTSNAVVSNVSRLENKMKEENNKKPERLFCAIPLFLGIVFYALKYVAWIFLDLELDIDEWASILVSELLCFAIISVITGACNGFGTLITQTATENETERRMLIRNGFWISILLSFVVVVMCMLCAEWIIRMLVTGDGASQFFYTLWCFKRLLLGIPFAVLFSYVMVLLRTMEDFKTPCLFITGAIILEFGAMWVVKVACSFADIRYGLDLIIAVKILLNILLSLGAYCYFRIRYSKLYQTKVQVKMNWKICKRFFKQGIETCGLGLPLALILLIEGRNLLLTMRFYYIRVLIEIVMLAPFMAWELAKRYIKAKKEEV